MPRTVTSVIEDIQRVLKTTPSTFDFRWTIPVEREGWEACVEVALSRWDILDPKPRIMVFAHGRRQDRPDRHAAYPAFFGNASPEEMSQQWVETVLKREIEAAVIVAQSFGDGALRKEAFAEEFCDPEFYRGMVIYFDSTLMGEASR